MGIIADLASIPLSIIQTRQNAKVQRENTDKTIRANRQLAEYQYGKDLEMWEKQNEYNSPQSQMNRYKQAGINPNMIVSQGNSGNASTLPRYQSPTVRYDYIPKTNLPEVLSRFQDFSLRNAQIDNVKADSENKRMQWVIQGLNSEWLKDRNAYLLGNNNFSGYWQSKAFENINRQELGNYNVLYRKKQLDAFDQLLTNTINQGNANILKNRETTRGIGIQNDFIESKNWVDIISKALGIPMNIFGTFRKPK